MNWDYTQKKVTEKNRPKGDVQDYFRSSWDAKKDEVLDWEGENPKELKELGTKGVDIFYDDVMKSVQPAEVQPHLELTFRGVAFRLTGRPDFIERVGTIGDNKTSSAKKPDSFIAQGAQPVLYSAMLDGIEGKPREVRYDILVKGKASTAAKAKPWVQQMKIVVTPDYRASAIKMVGSFVKSINTSLAAKNFPPMAYLRKDWACDYCGCKDLCRKVWGTPVGDSRIEVILKSSKDEQKAASAGDPAVIEKLKKIKEANEEITQKVIDETKHDEPEEPKRGIII